MRDLRSKLWETFQVFDELGDVEGESRPVQKGTKLELE
jgi:hypothetical protein